MRRALVPIGNITLALLVGIFLLFSWERAYYYVGSRFFVPVMTAHYKAVCYRDVDPIRDTPPLSLRHSSCRTRARRPKTRN
jgi:hypothetical protein